MRYVDGYVIPVPKKNLNAYRRMAETFRRRIFPTSSYMHDRLLFPVVKTTLGMLT